MLAPSIVVLICYVFIKYHERIFLLKLRIDKWITTVNSINDDKIVHFGTNFSHIYATRYDIELREEDVEFVIKTCRIAYMDKILIFLNL